MSAAVLALPTSHFATTDREGNFKIANIPPGHYQLQIWYELASESELTSLTREIDTSSETPPLSITLHSSDIPQEHLNQYGQQYSREKPNSY